MVCRDSFFGKSILSGIMGGIGTGVSFYISMSMWIDQFNWLSFFIDRNEALFLAEARYFKC